MPCYKDSFTYTKLEMNEELRTWLQRKSEHKYEKIPYRRREKNREGYMK
jgi:hypothetical protein